jgi:hypothetical protein
MNNIGFTADQCRKALESYLAEVGELMTLVEKPSLSPAEVQQAQSQLANLKACLKHDHRLRDTVSGQERMTHVEAAIFAPAVHQAFADLHVRSNSRPDAGWHSNLYDIHVTLSHAIAQLRD